MIIIQWQAKVRYPVIASTANAISELPFFQLDNLTNNKESNTTKKIVLNGC